jgi:hypothetical protein
MKRHLLMVLSVVVSLSILISSLMIWPSIEKGFLSEIEEAIRQTSIYREADTEQICSWKGPWKDPMLAHTHLKTEGSIQKVESIYRIDSIKGE